MSIIGLALFNILILGTISLSLGAIPDINFCRATMAGFGDDALYFDSNAEKKTEVDFTISTPYYPDSYRNGSCVCTLTTTKDQDGVSLNFQFHSYELKERDCPSLLYVTYNDDGFYVCSKPGHQEGFNSHVKMKSGDALKFYLVNEHNNLVKSAIRVSGIIGEYTYLKCVSERVDHDECKCSKEPPEYYVSYPAESNNTRVLIGFMAMLGFLILLGIAIGVWYYLRRRKKRKAKEEAPRRQTRADESIARNSAFFSDPDMPKNAHGIYAEIDFGAGLPFSPDPNLRLEMRGDESQSGAKYYRGSVDSGLYSEMSERANMNGMTPYATSFEALQILGPDQKYEPPASQSSPKLVPKSPEELEKIYAKPKKNKKKKKTNRPIDRQQSEDIYQHPPLPDRPAQLYVPPASQIRPNYNPDPHVNPAYVGSRSGSPSSALYTGQADLGQGILQSSRSSLNELYVTDSRSTVNLNGSRGTMETDI